MKKITSILLAFVLALTLVPTAWADLDGGGDTQPIIGEEVEETDAVASVTGTVKDEKVTKYFGNLIAAFAYADENTVVNPTVKLLYNCSIDDWNGTIPENITVDLNEKTLWVNMTQLKALTEKFSGTGTVETVDDYESPTHEEYWEYKDGELTEKTVTTITYASDASLRQCTNGHTPVPDGIDESNTIPSYTCAVCGDYTTNFNDYIPEDKNDIQFVEDNIGFWNGAKVVAGKEKATIKTVQTDGSGKTIFEETMVAINYGKGLFSEVSRTQTEYKDDKTIFTSWETKVDGNAVTQTYTDENGKTYQTVTSIKDGTLTIRSQSGENGQLNSGVHTETYTVTGRNVELIGREFTTLMFNEKTRWTSVLVVNGNTVTVTETEESTDGTYKSVTMYQYDKKFLDDTEAKETNQPKSQVITEKDSNGNIVRVIYHEYTYKEDVQCSDETETDGKAIVEKRWSEYRETEKGYEQTTTYYDAYGNWKAKDKIIIIYAKNGYECTTIVYDIEDNVTETWVEKCTYNLNDDGKKTGSTIDKKIYTGVEDEKNLFEIWNTVEVENEDGSTTSTKTIKDANEVEKGVEKSTWKYVDGKYVEISREYTQKGTAAETTVKTNNENGKVTATATVNSVDTAEAVDKTLTMDFGNTEAINGTAPTEIKVSISEENTGKLETAVENGSVKTVEVKTDVATLSIDSTAIKALTQNVENGQSLELAVANTSAESKEVQNTASDVKAEYKLTATVGNENVFDKSTADTNGEITVSVPYEKSTNGTVAVYYVDEATNAKTKMPSSYADGVLSWTTNHFSTFQVVETVQSSSSGNRHYSAVLASKTADTTTAAKVNSANTFDAGVGIYAASAILSVTGMAWVGKKKF